MTHTLVARIVLFASVLALMVASCKKDEAALTCNQKIQGRWECTAIDGHPPDFQIFLEFETDSIGKILVVEADGTPHEYPMDQWMLPPDCSWLSFVYYINGYPNPMEVSVKELSTETFMLQGNFLKLFKNDTRLRFQHR